jgi:hypothetical protein
MLCRFDEKCWNKDPLKRPSSKEVFNIFEEWVIPPNEKKIEDIDEELKCNIMEFINEPIGQYDNNLAIEYHPQACYTSRLFDFTSKKLNEILENEDLQASEKVDNILVSDDMDDCRIKN